MTSHQDQAGVRVGTSHGDPRSRCPQLKLFLALSTPPTPNGGKQMVGPRKLAQKFLLRVTTRAMQLYRLGPLQRLGDRQLISTSAVTAATEPPRWQSWVDPSHRKPATSKARYNSENQPGDEQGLTAISVSTEAWEMKSLDNWLSAPIRHSWLGVFRELPDKLVKTTQTVN